MTSGAGLMYAGIAVLWAAVLIPMWLRGHDNTVESRSAERFGQAMRVLSRRPGADDGQDRAASDTSEQEPSPRVAPAQDSPPRRTVSAASSEAATATPRPSSARRPQRQTAQTRTSLARRRARTLAGLAGVTLLVGLLAVVGVLPVWVPVPVLVLLVAFVVNLRNQAKRSEALRTRRQIPGTASYQPPAAESAPTAVADHTVGEQRRRRSRFVSGPSRAVEVETKRVGSATAAEVSGDQLAEQPATADATAGDDEAWRPNPLPLPTYVTAPKAMRPIKVIDLTTPGAWTSGRFLEDEAAAEEDLLAASLAADELDALLEHEADGHDAGSSHDGEAARRAVGD